MVSAFFRRIARAVCYGIRSWERHAIWSHTHWGETDWGGVRSEVLAGILFLEWVVHIRAAWRAQAWYTARGREFPHYWDRSLIELGSQEKINDIADLIDEGIDPQIAIRLRGGWESNGAW